MTATRPPGPRVRRGAASRQVECGAERHTLQTTSPTSSGSDGEIVEEPLWHVNHTVGVFRLRRETDDHSTSLTCLVARLRATWCANDWSHPLERLGMCSRRGKVDSRGLNGRRSQPRKPQTNAAVTCPPSPSVTSCKRRRRRHTLHSRVWITRHHVCVAVGKHDHVARFERHGSLPDQSAPTTARDEDVVGHQMLGTGQDSRRESSFAATASTLQGSLGLHGVEEGAIEPHRAQHVRQGICVLNGVPLLGVAPTCRPSFPFSRAFLGPWCAVCWKMVIIQVPGTHPGSFRTDG